MEWVRGDTIGQGSYSTVSLAKVKKPGKKFPKTIAVKSSSDPTNMLMLQHESSVLANLQDCPYIIRCFGKDQSTERGNKMYNLLLEHADSGCLVDKAMKPTNPKLEESDIRRYTKSLLEGVQYIHDKGYVHRDLKLENILPCSGSEGSGKEIVKIADFGLAKRAGEEIEDWATLSHLSPEAVINNEQEFPSDVWALGCMVLKMFTRLPVWRTRPEDDDDDVKLMTRIRFSDELPEFPVDLSPIAKDFLEKIFIKNPAKRWTTQKLLNHPFIVDRPCKEEATTHPTSPKGPLDWTESSCSPTKIPSSKSKNSSIHLSVLEKFRRLIKCQGGDWVVDDDVKVRQQEDEDEDEMKVQRINKIRRPTRYEDLVDYFENQIN